MNTLKSCALTLAVMAVTVGVAYAIKCWDCNSVINSGCNDPFKPDDFAMADCSQKFLPRFPNQPGSICRKITQKVNDEYRTIRGCGYLDDQGKGIKDPKDVTAECVRRAGTFSVLVQYCSCTEDGCNHSTHLIISSLVTLLVPIVSIFVLL